MRSAADAGAEAGAVAARGVAAEEDPEVRVDVTSSEVRRELRF